MQVKRYVLESDRLRVVVLNIGGVIYEIYDKELKRNLVVNYKDVESYLNNPDHIGVSITGPFSGRIRDGKTKLGTLDQNFLGKHHIHGGNTPLGGSFYLVHEIENGLVLTNVINDVNTNFSDLNLTVKINLNGSELSFEYLGEVSSQCLINITNHSYFNFDLNQNILDHQLKIDASHYYYLDHEMLPIKKCNFKDSVFDSLENGTIGSVDQEDALFKNSIFIDHPFVLNQKQVSLSNGEMLMTLDTTSSALVVYVGNYLDLIKDTMNTKNSRHHGICLEAQELPGVVDSELVWFDKDKPFYKKDVYNFEVIK